MSGLKYNLCLFGKSIQIRHGLVQTCIFSFVASILFASGCQDSSKIAASRPALTKEAASQIVEKFVNAVASDDFPAARQLAAGPDSAMSMLDSACRLNLAMSNFRDKLKQKYGGGDFDKVPGYGEFVLGVSVMTLEATQLLFIHGLGPNYLKKLEYDMKNDGCIVKRDGEVLGSLVCRDGQWKVNLQLKKVDYDFAKNAAIMAMGFHAIAGLYERSSRKIGMQDVTPEKLEKELLAESLTNPDIKKLTDHSSSEGFRKGMSMP